MKWVIKGTFFRGLFQGLTRQHKYTASKKCCLAIILGNNGIKSNITPTFCLPKGSILRDLRRNTKIVYAEINVLKWTESTHLSLQKNTSFLITYLSKNFPLLWKIHFSWTLNNFRTLHLNTSDVVLKFNYGINHVQAVDCADSLLPQNSPDQGSSLLSWPWNITIGCH